jgi:hypothetical protein
MNLREAVLTKYSRENCAAIVNWVGDSQQRFDQLFALYLDKDGHVSRMASWPLSYCVENYPALFNKKYTLLLGHLYKSGLHDSIKRNAVRLLQFVAVPEQYQGEVMNICFQYLEDPAVTVGVKAFSLTVLSNLAKQYPEIIPEVKILIEDQLPRQTAAFHVRAKAFLKAVNS